MNSNKPVFELFNGKLQEAGTPLFTSENRAFRYGDGLFETICVRNIQPLFIEDHWNRLSKGLAALSIPASLTLPDLLIALDTLLKKNDLSNARLRLIAFREAAGLYKTVDSACSWLLSVTGEVDTEFKKDMPGLSAGVFEGDYKASGKLSNLKTLNGLLFICAASEAIKMGLDEMLIKNQHGNLVESISANIFIRQGTTFKTPPLSEGCLEGVMRTQVIKLLSQKNLPIQEIPLTLEDLLIADELILTNVIQGAGWIENFKGKMYTNQYAVQINHWLNEMVGHKS